MRSIKARTNTSTEYVRRRPERARVSLYRHFDWIGVSGAQCHHASHSMRPKARVDVIDALNMTVSGYYAHLSAVKNGENMKIPQYSL